MTALLGVLWLGGCTDTINPVIGRLRLGPQSGPHKAPIRLDKHRFGYPGDAWEERVGGTVWLRLHITTEGKVDSAEVHESSGRASLDSAAMADARQLVFSPAQQNGELVEVWAHLPVIYPLPEVITEDDP